MSGLLSLILAVFLAHYSLAAGGAAGAAEPSPAAILAILLAWYAAGRLAADRLAAEALRGGIEPARALARFRRVVALHRGAVLPLMAAILYPCGGGSLAASLQPAFGEVPAILAALSPYLLLHVLSRAATWPAERRLGLQSVTFLQSLSLGARLLGFFVAPLAAITALGLGASLLEESGIPPFRQAADLAARFDFVGGTLMLGAVAAVLAAYPPFAMRILGAGPMPAGPRRERLEGYARRVGLAYRDLYVWPTRGTIPNAAVLGLGGRFRCVVFTDALLARLDDDEVEAVFAHEAGHALHHHLPFFLVFTTGFSLALVGAGRLLPPALAVPLEQDGALALVATLAALGAYFGLLLGFVSRRVEQQADVHGFLTIGLAEGESPAAVLADPGRHPFLGAVAAGAADPVHHPFLRSLERIAATMGGIREITGWRHFSIKDRVEFLDRYARDPAVRERYRRRLRGLMGLLAGLLLLFAAAAATDLPIQLRGPSPDAAILRAKAALREGRVADARGWIEAGLRGAEARGVTLAPRPDRLPRGRPVGEMSALVLGRMASTPGPERFRWGEIDALLRSVLGRPEEAVAAAESALADVPEGARRERREALLLLADLLDRDGRPRAAAAARKAAE